MQGYVGGTVADATSLAAKTVDAVAYDGSGEAVVDQAVKLGVNFTAGAVVGRVAGTTVRTNVAGRFFNPSNGRFVTNRFGNTVTAASDATRVSVSLGTSNLLNNN